LCALLELRLLVEGSLLCLTNQVLSLQFDLCRVQLGCMPNVVYYLGGFMLDVSRLRAGRLNCLPRFIDHSRVRGGYGYVHLLLV